MWFLYRRWIRMYSMRSLKGILLIETEKEIHGITPEKEELFIQELQKRLPG